MQSVKSRGTHSGLCRKEPGSVSPVNSNDRGNRIRSPAMSFHSRNYSSDLDLESEGSYTQTQSMRRSQGSPHCKSSSFAEERSRSPQRIRSSPGVRRPNNRTESKGNQEPDRFWKSGGPSDSGDSPVNSSGRTAVLSPLPRAASPINPGPAMLQRPLFGLKRITTQPACSPDDPPHLSGESASLLEPSQAKKEKLSPRQISLEYNKSPRKTGFVTSTSPRRTSTTDIVMSNRRISRSPSPMGTRGPLLSQQGQQPGWRTTTPSPTSSPILSPSSSKTPSRCSRHSDLDENTVLDLGDEDATGVHMAPRRISANRRSLSTGRAGRVSGVRVVEEKQKERKETIRRSHSDELVMGQEVDKDFAGGANQVGERASGGAEEGGRGRLERLNIKVQKYPPRKVKKLGEMVMGKKGKRQSPDSDTGLARSHDGLVDRKRDTITTSAGDV